jgi:hypothetical protein
MFILCTPTEFEKAPNIDPERLDRDWIEVTREEADRITNNREWQAVDNPDYGKVIGQRPFVHPLAEAENAMALEGKSTPILDTRRRIIVPREPEPPTPAELEAARRQAVRQGIHAMYPADTEARIQGDAIAAMAAGRKPSEEWYEYRADREKIIAEASKKGTP